MLCAREIAKDTYWIGMSSRRQEIFENVLPIPNGMSYNAYLIKDKVNVLLDTVDIQFSSYFMDEVENVLGSEKLDYVIVHHLEPDHAATLKMLLFRYPDVKVVSSKKGFILIDQFGYKVKKENMIEVEEGDKINFGQHTLNFVEAPMVHWPEVIMSYDEETGVLFSADAFGTFGALDGKLFSTDIVPEKDWIDEARRYYSNIVGEYGVYVRSVLGKLTTGDYNIKMICPLHGQIWKENIGYAIEKYVKWADYEPEEAGVLIVYSSMYGNTEMAANVVACRLVLSGVKNVQIRDVSNTDITFLISEVFRYSHIIVASVTYRIGVYPPLNDFFQQMIKIGIKKRTFGIIENGSWTCNSGDMLEYYIEEKMPENTILRTRLTVASAVGNKDLYEIEAFVNEMANSVREYMDKNIN